MRNRDIVVPELVRQKAVSLGAVGVQWLASLNDLVSELEQDWQISCGATFSGGTEAYVAQAITSDGSKVILKVGIPESAGNTVLANEISALKFAAGRGYVRLLRSDLTRRALLLESLGLPLADFGYSTEKQIEIICTTLRQSWLPVGTDVVLPTEAEITEWFAGFINGLWEQLARPCSERVVEKALAFTQARAKAFNRESAVLVHGDAHNTNTLQTLATDSQTSTSFKLIDPDGLIAGIGYDVGVVMREWPEEMLPDPLKLGQERCAYLHRLTGADKESIWQWGFIQSVSTGLLLLQVGQEQAGRELLQLAEAWVKV